MLTRNYRKDLTQYFGTILQLIYSRLDDPNLAESFKLRLVRFYHTVSALDEPNRGYGTDYFIAASDSFQDGAFVPLYLKMILPVTQQLAKPLDRKVAVISLTKTLTNSQKFATRYIKGWTLSCDALVKVLENAPVIATDDSVVVDQDVDDPSFGVGFTQLSTCRRQPRDLWPEIQDIKQWVGKYFLAADQKAPADAKPSAWLNDRASPEAKSQFTQYLRS